MCIKIANKNVWVWCLSAIIFDFSVKFIKNLFLEYAINTNKKIANKTLRMVPIGNYKVTLQSKHFLHELYF